MTKLNENKLFKLLGGPGTLCGYAGEYSYKSTNMFTDIIYYLQLPSKNMTKFKEVKTLHENLYISYFDSSSNSSTE